MLGATVPPSKRARSMIWSSRPVLDLDRSVVAMVQVGKGLGKVSCDTVRHWREPDSLLDCSTGSTQSTPLWRPTTTDSPIPSSHGITTARSTQPTPVPIPLQHHPRSHLPTAQSRHRATVPPCPPSYHRTAPSHCPPRLTAPPYPPRPPFHLPTVPRRDPATPSVSEAGDPHPGELHAQVQPDCRWGVLQIIGSPPAARYHFAGGAMLPQHQGAPARPRVWPNAAAACHQLPTMLMLLRAVPSRWFQLPPTRTA